MSKLSPKTLFILAIIISLLAAFLMYNQLNNVSKKGLEETREVVVATQDIPPKTLITAAMLKTMSVPLDIVQKGAYYSIQEVIGKYAKTAIVSGDQITPTRLADNERGSGLVAVIPTDKRAITIGVTDTTGLTGLAKVGDRVDIVSVKSHNGNVSGQILLQDIMIMAVNRTELDENVEPTKADKTERMANITLAVAPKDAVRIALAQAQGTLQLLLRPASPSEEFVQDTMISEQGAIPGAENKEANAYGIKVIRGAAIQPQGSKGTSSTLSTTFGKPAVDAKKSGKE